MVDSAPDFFSDIQVLNQRKQTDDSIVARPFLRWVGGKRSILPELLDRMPRKYNRYLEPFIGGGALFLWYSIKRHIF